MASNWFKSKLEDLDIIFADGDRSSRYPKANQFLNEGNHPFINTKNIVNNHFQWKNVNFISDIKFEEIKKGRVEKGDVVIATRGSKLGKVAYYEYDEWAQPLVNAQLLIIRCNDSRLHPQFLWLLLSSSKGQLQINSLKSGSAQPQLPIKDLKKFEIEYPDYQTQLKILETSNCLNKKIQLNDQTNQTLEQMAQVLFKSWFVDFDPVIDNALAAGTNVSDFPEAMQQRAEQLQDFKPLPDDIRALFPNEFEQSELGWIPKGWESGTIDDVAIALSGYAFKGKDFKGEGEGEGDAVIKIKNIKSDRSVDVGDVQRVSHEVSLAANSFHLNDGDLIMAMTGATVGKFGIVVSENDETLLLNQRVCKLSMKNSESNVFLFTLLSMQGLEESILNAAQGSAQPNISAKEILMTSLIIPPTKLISHFNRFMSTSFQKMITLRKQNYELSKLRDTLLPKLISGELKLQE
jgi:type I restriction enzyme S subunit